MSGNQPVQESGQGAEPAQSKVDAHAFKLFNRLRLAVDNRAIEMLDEYYEKGHGDAAVLEAFSAATPNEEARAALLQGKPLVEPTFKLLAAKK